MSKSRASATPTSGPGHAVVALHGAGRVQRRIWRAFMTFPDVEMTTADLVRWCYPRWDGEPGRHHRRAIVRAALRVATRVRRDRPGGVVFKAFGGKGESVR
jgi:hypothetical protein